jgi:cytochrome c
MIIPLISGAFLLTYLHKYTWHKDSLSRGSHRLIAIFAAILFLIIPFIFLVNANLMLFPERWGEVKGFFSALLLPNVFPRYMHFIAASITVTGLFLIGYLGRSKDPSSIFKREPHFLFEARRSLYSLCFVITAAQFIIGPLVLFTLPSHGISGTMLGTLLIAIVMAMALLKFLYDEAKNPTPQLSKGFPKIVFLFTVIVALMVSIRHIYREQALSAHKKVQTEKTQAFLDESAAAAIQTKSPAAAVSPEEKGKNAFASYCSGCHAEAKAMVGPALTEIRDIYKTDTAGIVKWTKAPGKKRPGMAMPAMNHVQEDDLNAIAQWILKTK